MSVMMATMHNPSLDNPNDNDQLEAPPSQRDYVEIYREEDGGGQGRERGFAEGSPSSPASMHQHQASTSTTDTLRPGAGAWGEAVTSMCIAL